MLLKTCLRSFNTSSRRALPIADKTLKEHDPELYQIIRNEQHRQFRGIELIASENFTYTYVLDCLGSVLTNKYSEGYPGARYYGGNQFIDQIENIARSRALQAYDLKPEEWGVNVQPYSGSPANLAVYTALMEPGDKLMGLDLTQGGHLTHGFFTPQRRVSASSIYFKSQQYHVDKETGLIDYDALASAALEFKPKLIIAGFSAYTRHLDYERFRQIADSVGAYLHADMAHVAGLVAAGESPSPFPYADVVTTTTHKTLRGPRAGMIFGRKHLMDKIDFAVFPQLQGGPHNVQIAAIAAQLKQVNSPEFKIYCQQVVKNAKHLAKCLQDKGHTLGMGGTDNHILLVDCRPHGLTGSKVEKACDLAHITINKNTLLGDKSAMTPGGIRIGTPAVTTRGYLEKDMEQVAKFISHAIEISVEVQKKHGKKLKDFTAGIEENWAMKNLADEVEDFAKQFDVPGIDSKDFKTF